MGEKIARLRQAGGAYRAACDLFINRSEMGLVGEDALTHSKSHPIRQNMLDRVQEEEETIEQARTQLEGLRKLEGGRSSSEPSSDKEPTHETNDIDYESLEDIGLKSWGDRRDRGRERGDRDRSHTTIHGR